jgi:hypothetical protein
MTTPADLRETYPMLADLIGDQYDSDLETMMPLVEKWLLVYHTLEEVGKRPEVVKDEEAPARLVGLDQLFVEVIATVIAQDLYDMGDEHYPGISDEQLEMLKLSSAAIAGICMGHSIAKNQTTFSVD